MKKALSAFAVTTSLFCFSCSQFDNSISPVSSVENEKTTVAEYSSYKVKSMQITMGDIFGYNSINSSGVACGMSNVGENDHLFKSISWKSGTVTILPVPSTLYVDATGLEISETGTICGFAGLQDDGDRGRIAVIWKSGSLKKLVTSTSYWSSQAQAINGKDQVVGTISKIEDGPAYPFYWNGSSLKDLTSTLGNASPKAINDAGVIAGSYSSKTKSGAFILNGTKITDPGTLGGTRTNITDINLGGTVVGSSVTGSGATHAFMYVNGKITDLGTLGGQNSYAVSINDAGIIVGNSETASGETRAFVYVSGKMYDLSGVSSTAKYISKDGKILGTKAGVGCCYWYK